MEKDGTQPQNQSNSPSSQEPDSNSGQDSPLETLLPSIDAVSNYLIYGLSLPERTLRSTSAAVGGAVKESAALLLPQAFRNSKSYTVLVKETLEFLAHDVGGVEREEGQLGRSAEELVARKAVGGFIDLAAMPLLHVSPLTVLAVVSDIAYGSQVYLDELSSELKKQGVIDEDSTIDHASDLLEAINKTTSASAEAMGAPPLSVEGLTETINQITEAANADVTQVLPQAEVERLWNEMHELAVEQDKDLLEISSAMTMFAMNRIGQLGEGALSGIVVAGNMFDRHILDHYWTATQEIHEKGYYTFLSETSEPYIAAVWNNFSTEKETITEDVLSGRLIGRTWNSIHTWFTDDGDKESSSSSDE